MTMSKISEELVKLAEENSTFVTGLIKENEALHLENAQLKRMAGAGGTEAMVILRPGEIDHIVSDAVAAEKAIVKQMAETLEAIEFAANGENQVADDDTEGMTWIAGQAHTALIEWRAARGGKK